MKENTHKGKLISKVIYIAVAAVVLVATVLTIFSAIKTTNAYHDTVEEMLKVACEQLESEMTNVWDGDWSLKEDRLFKGEQDVTDEYADILDKMNAETGIQYTVFYGDTRYVTTTKDESGKKTTGTKASEKVIAEVLTGGKEFFATDVEIGGIKHFAYYAPLKNSDGKVAGMVFAGRQRKDVDSEVTGAVIAMIILAVVLVVVMAAAGLLVSMRVSKMMRSVAGELEVLSKGNLNLDIDDAAIARKDEVGLIAEGAKNLSAHLGDVIRETMSMSGEIKESGEHLSNSSGQAYEASEQVAKAVDDISNGAVSQAESIQDAANSTDSIANDIDLISGNVAELDASSKDMETVCGQAMEALDKLIHSSEEVQVAVKEIGETINSTNESAKAISQFTQAINDIATQTNLLSLNASIEAARAGESGKGFAVVAGEIGGLAAQSSESADEIKQIVDQLVADSARSVEVMQKLNGSFEQQAEQIDSTKVNMESMASNVEGVAKNTEGIASSIEDLTNAKEVLSNIVSDLSAISEENAAAAEQTSASMVELNNTFSVITNEAEKLEKLASGLEETISYFKD